MSDSEDDIDVFNKGEVILIPKNRYKSRPLPHLFGGKDFFTDDSLGLLPSNDTEEVGENLFSGEDDNIQHSESSSTDEVDNFIPKNNLFTTTANEIKEISFQEKNDDLVENKKNNLEQTCNQDETFMDDRFSEQKADSQSPINNLHPLSFHNITQGAQMKSAIADEIKGIFGEEHYEGHSKTPVLKKIGKMKSEESIKNTEPIHVVKDSSKDIKEKNCVDPVPPLFNEKSWPQRESPKEAKIEHFPKTIPFKTTFPAKTIQCREERMSEEDILPYVPTEVLHSFAKSRPKIKGKRRLPTRKQKNISHNEAEVKQMSQDNVLSPSTDEEDLFVIPSVSIPKESSSDSLFGGPSLFSPGSFIEGEFKTSFTSSLIKKEEKIYIDEKEDLEEPLGIKKKQFDSDKRSNVFSDWDPFNSDDSALFSSVERKTRKTKLFDDIEGSSSQKSSKDNDDDDDLFLFPSSNASNSASSLFASSLSTKNAFTTNNSDFSRSSKLFDDGSSENLFSNSDHGDFNNSDNMRKISFNRQPNFGSKLSDNNDEKVENALYSNPLMDTEDDLFD